MSRIPLKSPNETSGSHKKNFDQIQSAFGKIPNMFLTIGNSSAALESMWGFFGALSKGKLDAKMSEQIAVYIADLNRCEYCLSAHTLLGQKAGATAAQMLAAQSGESNDVRTQAALKFAGRIVQARGQITTNEVLEVKAAGYSDEEVTEILAHVALNIFTNYTNNVFKVAVDFPNVALRKI